MSAFDAIGGEVDPAMANVDNRLPFMDKEKFCKEHGWTYYITWRPGYKDEMVIDANDHYGSFAEAACEANIRFKGKDDPEKGLEPTGLCGRTFVARDKGFVQNLQATADLTDEKELEYAALAKEHGIHGSWAIWRDAAVYEFGGAAPMEDLPHEVIAGIGGSTGPLKAASNAIMAAMRLKRKAKAGGAGGDEAVAAS